MQFKNFIEARKQAKEHKQKAEKGAEVGNGQKFGNMDPVIFKYFFDHQYKIEKGAAATGKGGMDYHIYARKMWEELIGDINSENQEFFNQFENTMILGLHKIDMEPLVYEHVAQSLTELVKKYQNNIKHIALWSTGDVEGTGYQVGKVESSKIVQAFHKALKIELPREQVGKIMKEQTSFFVLDNKLQALVQYATEALETNQGEKLKIVVIEDSRKNFEKVQNALVGELGDKYKQVELIPIWATYSREGQQAEKKASSSPDEKSSFKIQKEYLNAINSFDELLDTDRFESIFKDAHVFVDFDGVIGDNIQMREEQAKAIYSTLMRNAILSTGLTEQELVEKMKSKI
jgi:hypothetical protein